MKLQYLQLKAGMFFPDDMLYLTLQVVSGDLGLAFPLKRENDLYNSAVSLSDQYICVLYTEHGNRQAEEILLIPNFVTHVSDEPRGFYFPQKISS